MTMQIQADSYLVNSLGGKKKLRIAVPMSSAFLWHRCKVSKSTAFSNHRTCSRYVNGVANGESTGNEMDFFNRWFEEPAETRVSEIKVK